MRSADVERWRGWLDDHWLPVLLGGAVAVTVLGTVWQFAQDPFYVSPDSALFQHAGWYVSTGATPYVDFFDIKPPLVYAVTTVLAVLSGGDVHVLHVLSLTVAVAAVTAGVTLTGVLAHRLTGDGVAALAAGATVFVLPATYLYPYAGIRPKYAAFAFGVAALVLAVDDRPGWAGASAATATGFWQLGAPVALLVAATSYRRGGRRGLGRAVGGGAAVTAVVVLPFVLAGLSTPLFVNVVLAPLYGVERYTVLGRVVTFVAEFGWATLVVPVAAFGWLRGVSVDPDRYWWVAVGGAGYLLQIFLEFEGGIELVFLLAFLGVGVAVLVAETPRPSRRHLLVAFVALVLLANLYSVGGPVTPVRDHLEELDEDVTVDAYESLPPDPEGVPDVRTVYWNKLRPETCLYRLGHKQKHFVGETGGTLTKPTCGQWPFDDPPLEWLFGGLVPF